MAPHPRVVAAFHAMEALGISKSNVTPVLVNLLELYDKNWKPIEEDNYRFLADAIFDEVDSKVMKGKKKCKNFDEEESQLPRQPKPPLKRLRLGSDKDQISPSSNTCKPISGGTSLIRPKVEEDELLVYTNPLVGPEETEDMLAGDMPQYEPSIAADPARKGYSLLSDDSTGKQKYQGPVASQEGGSRGSHILASSIERRMKFEFSTISEESPCDFKSASSSPLEEMVDNVERPMNDTVILLSDDSETDAPSGDDSETDAPSDNDSGTEVPSGDDSETDAPSDNDSGTEVPSGDDSETDAPSDDDSETDAPSDDNLLDDSEIKDLGGHAQAGELPCGERVGGLGMGPSFMPKNSGAMGNEAATSTVGGVRKSRGKNTRNWALKRPEKLKFNKYGQAVAPSCTVARFSRFIGQLARDGKIFSLSVTDWRKFKKNTLDRAWKRVQPTNDWTNPKVQKKAPKIRKVVEKKLNDRWKQHKAILRRDWYVPFKGMPERFVCGEKDVSVRQWRRLVRFWDSKKGQRRSAANTANRAKLKMNRTTGPKTFAQLRYEYAKNHGGQEPDRITFFKMTQMRRNGKPVNARSQEVINDMDQRVAQLSKGKPVTPKTCAEVFSAVLGLEKGNSVRGYGAGVTLEDVPGIQTEKPKGASAELRALNNAYEERGKEVEGLRAAAEQQQREIERLRAEAAQAHGLENVAQCQQHLEQQLDDRIRLAVETHLRAMFAHTNSVLPSMTGNPQ